ncbi:NAD(P)H-binding protein [Rhizobium cauense]|uniref:NAD(P)H-binding protein n=1 Tax=Rhizobium cauense TaxID=1166683 RepID=UPI001C6E4705|nr:NAD(P)H-binding protein [Rhizobium cauense]MBW9118194.1 NAD(P)H-binding protein [Rhizobium cauense]
MSDTLTKRSLRIAVAGATGQIGSALLSKLVKEDVEIVALSRDPSTDRLPHGIAPMVVDFEKPSTLSTAVEGADQLFVAHGTSARQVENEIAVIDAAVAAGVAHIVKVSVMGPPVRLHPFDWHAKIEAHLATRDVGYTLLRPSTFVDILKRRAAFVAQGTWGGAAGEGRVNLIDTRDVADVALAVLLNQENLQAQRAYHLTGPASVSMPEVAAELSRLLGAQISYDHRTPEEHRKVLLEAGLSEMIADLQLGLDRLFKLSVQAETTSTVFELTGQPPRSAFAWLKENLAAFQPVK